MNIQRHQWNAFFPLKWWPMDMQLKFWKKPIGDKDTFQLVLFLLGNGCAPYLLKRWIMLSQLWATHQYHRREEPGK